jgi:hypothetical protein
MRRRPPQQLPSSTSTLAHPLHQGRPGESSRTARGSGEGLGRRRARPRQPTTVLRGAAGERDDFGAESGAGGQDAMEAKQVKPGRGNQHAECLDELPGIEEPKRGAIAARMAKLVAGRPARSSGGPRRSFDPTTSTTRRVPLCRRHQGCQI